MYKSLKRRARLLALATVAVCSFLTFSSQATAAGLMRPVGDTGQGLEIRDHKVSVVIENGYAITTVDQVFANPSSNDLEATYHFPVPERGAVSEFTTWIDGQAVTGEVFKKDEARQIYQEEKNAGREVGLAEKNSHYNFEIRVSPVRANQDTRVRLVYMQPVKVDHGVGRYVYPLADGETDDLANSFWTADNTVNGLFAFDLKLRSSYPVAATRLPAHPQAVIQQLNSQEWQVSLVNQSVFSNSNPLPKGANDDYESIVLTTTSNTSPATIVNSEESVSNNTSFPGNASVVKLDKDIVFYWRLDENSPPAIDVITHKTADASKGTFMMAITPGDDLDVIQGGRDWVFVLDQSGSMQSKYDTLAKGISKALGQLTVDDRFRVFGFNDSAREITSGWQTVNESNVRRWSDKVRATSTGGGTNLYAGTEIGLKALDRDRTSAIVLITDGVANVGTVEKKMFLKLMKQYDVRLFTAIMGNGANRPLLEGMTKVSNGFAVNVSNQDDIVGKLMEFSSKATHKALHNIKLDISGVQTSNITPQVMPSLYRGEQLIVMGHYSQGGVVDFKLSVEISGEKKQYTTSFELPAVAETNPEIERLWAYASIQDMQDMVDYLGDDREYKQSMTELAVNYGLVTDYTSMVVLREEQFAARGIERKNRDRRQVEQRAAEQRAVNTVANTRVDSHQPAFTGNRATYQSSRSSGGGSIGWFMFLISLLAFYLKRPQSESQLRQQRYKSSADLKLNS